MKSVEFFNFMLPPSAWSKKPYRSRFKMDLEYAAKNYPGSSPILGTREVRQCPETEEELTLQSAIQPFPIKPKG